MTDMKKMKNTGEYQVRYRVKTDFQKIKRQIIANLVNVIC